MGCRIIRIKNPGTKKVGIGLWTLALPLALALAWDIRGPEGTNKQREMMHSGARSAPEKIRLLAARRAARK